MKILCVDDERPALNLLQELCMEINSENIIYCFTDSFSALEFARDTSVDVALLDVDMPAMSGIELGKKLKSILPSLNIIMVTAYSQYSLDAFSMDASGYLTKPISADRLRHQFEVLRFPIKCNLASRVRINRSGGFQIFIDDYMPRFKYNKTLDLLSYLVEQDGAFCSNQDIQFALWSDNEDHYEYVKSIKKDLISSLSEINAEDILLSHHGRLAINKNIIWQ